MKNRFFRLMFLLCISLCVVSCSLLWDVENTTDLSFRIDISSIKNKQTNSARNNTRIGDDDLVKLEVHIIETSSTSTIAKKTEYFNEKEDIVDITFNSLDIVKKNVHAVVYLEIDDTAYFGKSEDKKMLAGINYLNVVLEEDLSADDIRTFYVSSTNSDDSNDGTIDFPFATIQEAIERIENDSSGESGTVYFIYVSGDHSVGTIAPTNRRNIRIQGYDRLDVTSHSVENLNVSKSSSYVTLTGNIAITNLTVSDDATVILSNANVVAIDFASTNVNLSIIGVLTSPLTTIKVPTNTPNNTLLITNSGSIENFELSSSNTGNLFVDGGNLYYSTGVITNDAIDDVDGNIKPSDSGDVSFDSGTWNIVDGAFVAIDPVVIKPSSISIEQIADYGIKPLINVSNTTTTSVEPVSGSSTPGLVTLTVTLTANENYMFDSAGTTTKTIEMPITFKEWVLDSNINVDSMLPINHDGMEFTGTWSITNGAFSDSSNATITINEVVTNQQIATVLQGAINIDGVNVTVAPGSDVIPGNVTMTATLTPQNNYVLEGGVDEKEISIAFTVKTEYIVAFYTEGGSGIVDQKVLNGELVPKPVDPTKADNTFAGWYTDQEHTNEYDFTTPVTNGFTLYAKWESIYTNPADFTVTDGEIRGYIGTDENIVIPLVDVNGNQISKIGFEAFKDNTRIKTVVIPDNVVSIGDYSFQGCNKLINIIIPNKVTIVGYYAFDACSSLESVTITNSVKTIKNYAFRGCSSLKTVYSNLSRDSLPIDWNRYNNDAFYEVATWLPLP